MIYTVTLNPSLDYVMHLKKFEAGVLNRSEKEEILPGGKGINVSVLLTNMGVETTALGFVGGFTGNEIIKRLAEKGINTDFVIVQQGNSRVNVKIIGEVETEVNAAGPYVTEQEYQLLKKKLIQLGRTDVCVLSGSALTSLGQNVYRNLVNLLSNSNCKVVVDTTKGDLLSCLPYHPFLIKPNRVELEELFDVRLSTTEQMISYAKRLQDMGAVNVLISLGKEGAILLTHEGQIYMQEAPYGEVYNSVGAGDSMIAGFLYGYQKEGDMKEALRIAVAAGSASAFSKDLATMEEVKKLLFKLTPIKVIC